MAKKEKDIPTVDEVYEHCKKIDPDKFEDLQKSEIDIKETGLVLVRGRFVKGYTGNTLKKKERLKRKGVTPDNSKIGLTEEEIKIYGKDAKKALEFLLETAKSRAELERISNKLIPYQAPKLSNIESHSYEEKKIEVMWVDSSKDLIDITPEEYDLQLKAAEKILITQEEKENVDLDERHVELHEEQKEVETVKEPGSDISD